MNINTLVKSALSTNFSEVHANVYNGVAEKYIVFNYSDERPSVYADDTDTLDDTSIQVHLFTKENPSEDKKTIRRLLRLAGFSIVSTSEFYEADTGKTHVIVDANIEGIIND